MDNRELVRKAMRRDKNAFGMLIQNYTQDMYKVGKTILMNDADVADAIQEAILTAWIKMDKLQKPESFKPWLLKILVNKCYDLLRYQKREIPMDEMPEEGQTTNESNLIWEEAMSLLDEKYRIIMTLFYGEGFRSREIAKILKMPESTVRTRLVRGREQLAEYYRA